MAERSVFGAAERLSWTPSFSLTARMLAVNIIALGLLAGSIFYLDSYRRQLLAERFSLAATEVQIAADALSIANNKERRDIIMRVGQEQKLRLRLYNSKDKLIADSFELSEPSFRFVDPASEPWYQHAGRALDRGMDYLLGAPPIPDYRDPEESVEPEGSAWPEVQEARNLHVVSIRQRRAPDQTPVITAAVRVGRRGEVLLTTRNAPDITQNVRDARQTLAIIVGTALLISILLSLFLARTIVQPLRSLVRAAVRVRLGRDREVVVPRLPERRDEIGLLARAISDMTTALRQRIDAVESFAADVAHEIKNPLASLRSALETLEKVEDAKLRRQLTSIAAHDVRRIDRLVTEIADASRIDAELSRTAFEPLDIGQLVRALVTERQSRGVNRTHPVSVATPPAPGPVVSGDAPRLCRVLENLLDNAVSFSPENAPIEVEISHDTVSVQISISDHGPGISEDSREKVFQRFHSLRPDAEAFGSHSGLGLAIARTIVEAHDGSLTAHDRRDGEPGARLVIDLPPWSAA